MKDFIIAIGHTASGNAGCGAVDKLDESDCNRAVGPLVQKYMEQSGKTTSLLRIDVANSYNCADCYTRASQANDIGAEWYVEIHFNSGKGGVGDGTEVCISNQSAEVITMAAQVSSSISNALGIQDRGVRTENLIVLKRTSMKAILVECMFVDCGDATVYNADTIALAIAEGLLGSTISNTPDLGWNKSKDGTKWWYCTDTENQYYYKSEWKLIDSYWYLFNDNGFCHTGWVNYTTQKDKKDIWYYLDKTSCQLAIGWKKVDGSWYFFNTDGEMQIGWIKDNGKDYCLYSSGAMISSIDMYGYRFASDGVATKLS
ncbi:hypothetical protein psyc5s11_29790 [Clostridium gelidum]|uniref:MurNAc-LAA domain-containing protein n=1 Tax=Clostridium gelidum TaxID=704125 RepID=A0ABN6IXR2_9CLOT|nr:N-acetylmuramoyl-L-alanine amidase [Clostridium gelidum]BCZ46912.1 hypothetical protein psyc5s11_29790 [Clostridium gelidum]